jgi:squalene-hopene/tetraprenyl-beta-curcumene cyclase
MMRILTPRSGSAAATVAFVLLLAPSAEALQTPPVTGVAWNQAAAADYLDGRQAWWRSWEGAARDHDTSCVSCHTALPYALARPALRTALREAGTTPPETDLLADVRKRVSLWNEVEPYYPDQTRGLPKTSESRGTEAILNALILANRDASAGRLSEETRAAFDHLWALQFTRGEETGAWAWLHFGLAPWESEGAEYFGAALAAVAVGMAPEGYAASGEIQERLGLLRAYLTEKASPGRSLDPVMLLWAGSELPGLVTETRQRDIVRHLTTLQNRDGGWSLASLGQWTRQDGTASTRTSDGYATGLIAFVLQRAGLSPSQEPVARALSWLVQNQNPDTGQWPASSLNVDRDPASDRGRFMSDAATAFAVLALTGAE